MSNMPTNYFFTLIRLEKDIEIIQHANKLFIYSHSIGKKYRTHSTCQQNTVSSRVKIYYIPCVYMLVCSYLNIGNGFSLVPTLRLRFENLYSLHFFILFAFESAFGRISLYQK